MAIDVFHEATRPPFWLGLALLAGAPVQAPTQDVKDPDAAAAPHVAPRPRAGASRAWPGLPDATASERTGLGLLSVIDQFQMDASRLALDRDTDDAVHAFAATLLHEQSRVRAGHDAWLPDLNQARAQARIRDGQQTLSSLAQTEGPRFQAAYLHAIQQSQAEALALLDEELIPGAANEAVRAHLLQARARITRQLETTRRQDRQGGASQQESRHDIA